MEQTQPTMPLYRCHKQVRAAQIIGIVEQIMDGNRVHVLYLHECQPAMLGMEWIAKHQPEVGGYLVQYEDGYLSCSPKEAFEQGYAQESSVHARMHKLASSLQSGDRTVTVILRDLGEGRHHALIEAGGLAREQVPLILKLAAEGTAGAEPTVERG